MNLEISKQTKARILAGSITSFSFEKQHQGLEISEDHNTLEGMSSFVSKSVRMMTGILLTGKQPVNRFTLKAVRNCHP